MYKKHKLIVIGGGASGLMFTAISSLGGLVLEGTGKTCTKLLASGSGQCNITHGGSVKDFTSHYGKNGNRIRGCLFKYSNLSLCSFLKENGIDTVQRNDGKIFPKSLKSSDIANMLRKKTEENGFDILLNHKVTSIQKADSGYNVYGEFGKLSCEILVIASGGCSYPSTGSDGSIYKILENDLNINIENPVPALVPISVENYRYSELSGISFDNAVVSIYDNDKICEKKSGSLLITHTQFSGPAILSASRGAVSGRKISINYIGIDTKRCHETLMNCLNKSTFSLETAISASFNIPKRFAAQISMDAAGKTKIAARLLTDDSYIISGTSGFKQAMVTAGGVSLDEVNLKTMEVNKYKNLYVIGEALDIDGETGGYNLQFCFSSAHAAVNSIKNHLL